MNLTTKNAKRGFMVDGAKIILSEVIIHSIPRADLADKNTSEPSLTDLPVSLDLQSRSFLQEKLRTALVNKGRPIAESAASSAAAAEIKHYLASKSASTQSALVPTSRALAELLHAIQPGSAPAGMVLVADCGESPDAAILVAKLDQEIGIRAFPQDSSGKRTMNIQFLNDLFITKMTNVFKIGLFSHADVSGGALRGVVVDDQMSGSGVAGYFLRYLGCEFNIRPQEQTEQFFKAVQGYVNSGSASLEDQAKIELALVTVMQSNSASISPVQFAADHVAPEEQDAFVAAITAANVPATFTKDTELIDGRLKRIQIETFSDVIIMTSPERLADDTVRVVTGVDGAPDRVEVSDDVKRWATRGKRAITERRE